MMKKIHILSFLVVCLTQLVHAQQRRMDQDPSLNNLVHAKGYVPCELGTLGCVTKVGTGSQDMILIAGAGFDGDIYNQYMEKHKERYSMYAVTLPGSGGTAAPPMPSEGTSYSEQTWIRGAQKGIENLIVEKKLKRPIVVGHWMNATEVALRLALDHPDKISAAVIISGVAKDLMVEKQLKRSVTPEERALRIDKGMAPHWFKTVTRDTWDDNNYYPHDYARHPVRALQLWRQAAAPSLPVWVRYLCEAWAYDITTEFSKLKVPTLVLMPGFDKEFYFVEGQDYMRTKCQESWNGIESLSDKITIQTIEDARVFIMDDQPEKLDQVIEQFLQKVLD